MPVLPMIVSNRLFRMLARSFLLASVAAICMIARPSTLRAQDPPAAPEKGSGVSEEQVNAAELKAREAEVEALKAQIEFERLKAEQKIGELNEKLKEAQEELTVLAPAIDDKEGFIHNWLIIGPIYVDEKVKNHNEESCKQYLDRSYFPPEHTPRPDEKLNLDGNDFHWMQFDSADYFVNLAKIAQDQGKEPEQALYLGTVYVIADEETADVKLAIGSDDDSVWRLNGKEVIRAYESRGIDKDQNTAEKLTLKKGLNVLTFTVINGDGECAAAARFLDGDNHPVKGLKFSVTSPEK